MECSGLLLSHQYAYNYGVSSWNAILDIVYACHRELDSGRDARELAIVQFDFSAAFDRVNHRAFLFKLGDAGIGGPILAVLGNFLSDRTQIVKLYGVRKSVVNGVSSVPQASVSGLLLFLL